MNQIVGTTIKELRKQKKFSQEKLAEAINSHQVYISEIESGEKLPSLILLYKIAKAFNMNLTDLIQIIESKYDDSIK